MRTIKKLALLTAFVFAMAGVAASSASADLHERAFHGVQTHGTFTGPLGLTCHDSTFEGEITDGAGRAEGLLTSVVFDDCEPACGVAVSEPVEIHVSNAGVVHLENVEVTINCGTGPLHFEAAEVIGQWNCANSLSFVNQEFTMHSPPTGAMAFWTSEWNVSGLEAEGACG